MDEESFWFHTKDKQELFVKCWKKTDKPKAIILIAHGMAEHIERYNEVASYFADHHFIVYGHDHRGHGKTGQLAESLGFFAEKDGFDLVVQDLMELTTFIKEKHPNIPIFLIGHSMGSFICRRYMMLNGDNLNGVILIGTGFQSPLLLKAAKKIAKYMVKIKGKRTASPFLNNLTFLNYNKRTNQHSSFDWLCTDQYVITKYKQDPLCGFIPSNQFFYDLYDGMETIQSAADSKKIPKLLPLLLLSGKDDPVGQYGQGVQKAINFYQSLELYSVNYHIYDKNRHEILNEVNKKEVFQDITNWLDGQITCNNKKQSI